MMNEQISVPRAFKFMSLGAFAGVVSGIVASGIAKLWPNQLTFALFLLGAFIAPVVFCAVYPLRLVLETKAPLAIALLVVGVVVGACATFVSTVLITGIIATIGNHSVEFHK